ncbi:uncharacterized protein LOC131144575 isoform X2 [Malania oleifera]|nr:uncharacterized protein LOC131144575 isoform X2 [Malania oleifera]
MADPKDKGQGIAGIWGSGYYLPHTDADATRKIDELIAPIRYLGVNMLGFTVEGINAIGLTTQGFTKITRIFKAYSEPNVLEKLLKEATRETVLTNAREITLKQFIDLCQWLRTPEGQRVAQDIQRAVKIKRKAGKSENIQGFAYAQILQLLLQDMSAEARTIRTQHEAAIAALRKEIMMHEASMQAELDGLGAKYDPPAE